MFAVVRSNKSAINDRSAEALTGLCAKHDMSVIRPPVNRRWPDVKKGVQ